MKRDIISLGKNCFVATTLREVGILDRKKDFFDDLGTPSVSFLADALSRRLTDFFSSFDQLDFYGKSHTGTRYFVYDKRTGILSSHHWKVGADRHECYQKFMRDHNPDAFIKKLQTANNPIILRTNEPDTKLDEVIYLHNVLADIRQNFDFTLCVFQDALWAEFEDWQKFLGLETRSLVTFRTWVYDAPAEIFPTVLPMHNWYWKLNDFSRWSKIFDYIFVELGMDIKTKDPLALKYL